MTGEKGSQILTFLAEFLSVNDSNRLNKYITGPFIVMCQKKLNAVAEEDLKREEEYKKEIEDLKEQIQKLTAEPLENAAEMVKAPIKLKKISKETVKEVMQEVKKK